MKSHSFASIGWSNPTYSIKVKNDIVYIDYHCVMGSAGVGGSPFNVATLPTGTRPTGDHAIKGAAWGASSNGQRVSANIEVKTDGRLIFVSGGTFIEAGFTLAYPI